MNNFAKKIHILRQMESVDSFLKQHQKDSPRENGEDLNLQYSESLKLIKNETIDIQYQILTTIEDNPEWRNLQHQFTQMRDQKSNEQITEVYQVARKIIYLINNAGKKIQEQKNSQKNFWQTPNFFNGENPK